MDKRDLAVLFADRLRSLVEREGAGLTGFSRQTGIDRVESAYLEWAVTRPAGAWLLAGLGARQYLIEHHAVEDMKAMTAKPSGEALRLPTVAIDHFVYASSSERSQSRPRRYPAGASRKLGGEVLL
ncbi:MAG: hypothetical protein AAFV49_13660, partial [Pseudomonadota bacterium]